MGKKSGFKPSISDKGVVKVLGRLSYCNATKRTKSNATSRELYRTNLLIYKDDRMDGLENLEVAREGRAKVMEDYAKFKGKDKTKLLKGMDPDRRGILSGDEYTNEEGDIREHYEGTWFLKLTSDRKPKFKNKDGSDMDDDDIEAKVKSGHWAVVYYHYYCVSGDDKGGNGVFTTLDAIQFFKKDELFAAGELDDDEIENLGDDEDEDDDMDDKKKSSGGAKRPSLDDDDDI